MNIRLKRIQPDDLNILASLFVQNDVPVITDTFNPFPLNAETAQWIACEARLDRFYIAFLEDTAVGFSMLRGWDEGYNVPSFGIFIDFRFHGRGLGSLVLEQTIEEARKAGCEKMRLSVYANNPAALAMYIHKGFIETERVDTMHLGHPDQKIIMIKGLT